MPIEDFEDKCFVAFTDISGFKKYMKDDRAALALDALYRNGYDELQGQNGACGIFVSDCGIIFTKGGNKKSQFETILRIIKNINNKMLDDGYMLTTTIAYGDFSYHNRIECPNILKNPVYGNAYLAAYLDNEKGKVKIQPGQCRIKKEYLEDIAFEELDYYEYLVLKGGYYYFYWNLDNPNDIDLFEKEYKDSYNQVYSGMKSALEKYRREHINNQRT